MARDPLSVLVQVAEMTGDVGLTRRDMETVNVIVTVPEKWDVLTRNNSAGGGSSDMTLMRQVMEHRLRSPSLSEVYQGLDPRPRRRSYKLEEYENTCTEMS